MAFSTFLLRCFAIKIMSLLRVFCIDWWWVPMAQSVWISLCAGVIQRSCKD